MEQQLVKIFTCFSRVFLSFSSLFTSLQTSTQSTPQIHCMRSASSTTTTTTEIQSNSPRSRGSTTVINSPPSTQLNHKQSNLSTNQDDEVTVEDLLYDAQVSVYSPTLHLLLLQISCFARSSHTHSISYCVDGDDRT